MLIKTPEEDDPMELTGVVLPGEPGGLERMAETFVEEFVRLGWQEEHLLKLFTQPYFLATHRIYRQKGEEYVRQLIRKTQTRWSIQPRHQPNKE
ncbi:MAG: hypothetical protein ANABAC_1381 [Anaerolineae bacterium]|jgi:hypothetical protein|nr:MAG: hypothetical protein ANABAC_1381 [Anaerolineae bacterium]